MDLSSPDLKDGSPIAREQIYPRCGGSNISPALSWSGVPKKAKSLAFTVIDTSVAPNGWSHWIVVDLPVTTTSLDKGVKELPKGARTLVSDFGDAYYDGPCPPKGTGTHRYEFTIWALPMADVPVSDGSAKFGAWLASHAIDKARITGTVTP
jgi:Raf kinase inhibitor-like YbhB/YbcL family protein